MLQCTLHDGGSGRAGTALRRAAVRVFNPGRGEPNMPKDPRVDAYIERAQPFAQPILRHLRDLVHRARPDIEEAIKWSMPMFLYNGKIVANMAGFKAHASFGTWKREAGSTADTPDGMGQLGKLATLADLPPDDEIIDLVQRAVAAVEAGGTVRKTTAPKPPPEVPADLRAALDAVPAAATAFDGFPPGARREYTDWVTEAKQPATRARRIAQAVEWCAEGKRRYWAMPGR
jgi:uncharacterized protein YdeI (YjbR/CyaY-like superfamily)